MPQQIDKTQYMVTGGILLATVVILGGALYFMRPAPPVKVIADPSGLASLQTTGEPWVAEFTNLKTRLNSIGLPALSAEGNVLHIHQHIDIYIDGKLTLVPPNIGVDPAKTFIAPLHVHDTTQVIHVESNIAQDFTLGQFFDVWGVKLTADCIGGYCNAGDKKLRIYSNGKEYSGDPRELVLSTHQEIAVVYGNDAGIPNPVPSSYAFPPNE